MFVKAKVSDKERLLKKARKSDHPLSKAIYAKNLLKEGRLKEIPKILDEKNPYGIFVLFTALVSLKETEKAKSLAEYFLQENPFCLGLRKKLAELYISEGKAEEAKKHLEFLLLLSDDPASRALLNEALKAPEEPEEVEVVEVEAAEPEAEEEKVIVLDEEPEEKPKEEDEFVSLEYVRALMEQCHFEEALEKLEKLLKTEPENQEALELKRKLEGYVEFLRPEAP